VFQLSSTALTMSKGFAEEAGMKRKEKKSLRFSAIITGAS